MGDLVACQLTPRAQPPQLPQHASVKWSESWPQLAVKADGRPSHYYVLYSAQRPKFSTSKELCISPSNSGRITLGNQRSRHP